MTWFSESATVQPKSADKRFGELVIKSTYALKLLWYSCLQITRNCFGSFASHVVDLESSNMMPAHKPKLFKVTYAGRVEVDTNSLVYSKEAQRIMAGADRKIASAAAADTGASKTPEREGK